MKILNIYKIENDFIKIINKKEIEALGVFKTNFILYLFFKKGFKQLG
jgi:hypothetical protein